MRSKGSSSDGARRSWRDPVIRARRIEGMIRAFDDPLYLASGESAEPKPAPPDWSPKIYSFRNILQETVWVVGDSCVLGHYRSEAEAKAAFERNVAERAKKEKADDHEAAP